jgi:hydroxymethylpyrimidine/phosphomethylpyrimidine kinase
MRDAARRIHALGPRVVVVKGGHLDGNASGDLVIDVVCTAHEAFEVRGPRIGTRHTHGTGCTFASAITAQLATGRPVEEAVRWAREYLEGAIRHAPGLGAGHGPLQHFWRVY